MTGSHITEFHKHKHKYKHKEPVTTKLLNNVLNEPGAASKHNIGWGHHNRNDTQSISSVDCKLAARKDESFSYNAVKNGGVAENMGDTLNMVEEFINGMVLETSHMDAPTMVNYDYSK